MATKEKAQHTPGEWTVRLHHDGSGFGIFAQGKDHSLASANLYEHTAYVGLFGPSETEANANLMAAAPELLAALEGISRWVEEHKAEFIGNCINSYDYERMMKPAFAAIRKARGE